MITRLPDHPTRCEGVASGTFVSTVAVCDDKSGGMYQQAKETLATIDKNLVKPSLMSRDDQALALGAGQPFAGLPESRQKLVALRAAGYASCLRETVDRSK